MHQNMNKKKTYLVVSTTTAPSMRHAHSKCTIIRAIVGTEPTRLCYHTRAGWGEEVRVGACRGPVVVVQYHDMLTTQAINNYGVGRIHQVSIAECATCCLYIDCAALQLTRIWRPRVSNIVSMRVYAPVISPVTRWSVFISSGVKQPPRRDEDTPTRDW